MINQIKKVGMASAKKAGAVLIKKYKNFDRITVKLKAKHEIVTEADLLSEKIILKEIMNNFPDHEILSEESGKNKNHSDYLWIIDPVDGTTNFSMHNPMWCVSIGLAYKGEIILGIIYAPILDELYIAEKGKETRRNGKIVKASKNIKKALHTFCHGRENKFIKKALKYCTYQKLNGLDCRQLGSAAIELAFVASGRTESIMIPGTKPWDVAAGVLMVRESGGKVTNFKGEEWTLKDIDILASNGKMHDELLKVVNRK